MDKNASEVNRMDKEQISFRDVVLLLQKGKKTIGWCAVIFLFFGVLFVIYRNMNPVYENIAEIQIASMVNRNQLGAIQSFQEVNSYIQYLINFKARNFNIRIPPFDEKTAQQSLIQVKDEQNLVLVLRSVGTKNNSQNYLNFYQYIFSQVQQFQKSQIIRNTQLLNTSMISAQNEIKLLS